ncbi:TetR/AcrR family transcriptional regulator [Pseudonocardia eucalypti]|uniref:TetR/AcrR family transcriptional regulator n=2 Tax=Pseudonocardia eucalypti TaxID=648755 RepID=A0ABP9Q3B4_9PSEU
MVSSSTARGIQVRRRLLAAAVELIPERGWVGVSTRVLAERAGVTPSVVHYHFSSLSELLNEAVVGVIRQALAEVDAFLETIETPVGAVEALFASVEHYSGADPMSRLTVETYLAAGRDERLRARIAEVVDEFRRRFGRWLGERGIPLPEQTVAVLVAAIDGLLLQRGLGARLDAESVVAVLRRLVGPDLVAEVGR